MLLFSYEARNRTGDRFEGSVEAASRREAAQKIRQRGLWVAALRLQGEEGKETGLLARVRERPHWLRLSARSLDGRRACVLFLRQLSLLTAAGLPLHEALGVLAGPGEVAPSTAPGKGIQSGNHSAYAEMVGCLRAQVLRGEPLSAALAERPDVFPASVCQLVRMGEESGSLDSILPELADHMELAMRTRAKLRAAMAYPLLLFVTALVAGVLMTLFILPAFAALLASLSAELPWPTRMLLACSGFLQSHGLILLLGTGAILFGSSWFFSRPGPRGKLDSILLRLPFFGPLLAYGEWQTVFSLLGILLQHGVPLDRALALGAEVPGNRFLRNRLRQAQLRLQGGSSLMAALGDAMLPPFLAALVAAGEAAGKLEEMMARGADLARFSYEEKLRRLEVLVEPVLTLLIGGMIFFFVLSVILPLLTTMDALG